MKHEDDDDAFLDAIIATNKIDIGKYKIEEPENDEALIDKVISWYLEKLEVIETFEAKKH